MEAVDAGLAARQATGGLHRASQREPQAASATPTRGEASLGSLGQSDRSVLVAQPETSELEGPSSLWARETVLLSSHGMTVRDYDCRGGVVRIVSGHIRA